MSFDSLAPHYRWMEWLLAGKKLQRCRTAFLPRVGQAQNILILGEGHGRFLEECRRVLAGARITCLDASGVMLAVARRRLQRLGLTSEGVEFIHANALAWKPPRGTYDLIVTHFFLDCFRSDQLQEMVARLALAAKPRAAWLIADFAVPAEGPGRYRALVIHRLMYAFFRLATRIPARVLTPVDDFLRAHQFELGMRISSEWGLLQTDLWERDDCPAQWTSGTGKPQG
jgi:ubiquinone/menaquinone biosynthesis C-methylase UbiE